MTLRRGHLFFSGTALLSMLILFFIWSVVPIGGDTLPHLLEENWNWSFRFSALLVSVITAISGICTVLLFAGISLGRETPDRDGRD